jgi:crossover junction endodeoxyribonuclease RusA
LNAALLPWPHKALSPNARPHYLVRHKAARASRSAACVIGTGGKCLQNPVCAVVPLVRDKRARDIDNVLAGLKSALDGLTDAGWWKDDSTIVGIHLSPPLYSPKFAEKRILMLAVEQEDERDLGERVRRFREDTVTGLPHDALLRYFGLTW